MRSLESASSHAELHSMREMKFRRTLFRVQSVGLLLLYPGFFFYHFGVAFGVVPSFLGGYYGVTAGILLPILILLFTYGASRGHIIINRIDVVFLLLCLYCVLLACIYRFLGAGHQVDPGLFAQSIAGILVLLANYLIFRQAAGVQVRHLLLLLLSGLGMLVIAWANQGGGVFIARGLADASTLDVVASYQGFARSAVVVLFILMAWITRLWLIPVYYLGLTLLFLLSARSEFGGFLFVGFVVLIVRLGSTKFLLLAAPALIAGFAMLWGVAYGFSDSSRILGLMDWQADTSLASRLELSARAWQTIIKSPFIGDYGSYLVGGGPGEYAHNMLSAWVEFGLVGFVSFAYLLLSSIRVSIAAIRSRDRNGEAFLGFGLAIFGGILAVFAKSMFFPLFAAAWGAAAGLINAKRSSAPNRIQGSGL